VSLTLDLDLTPIGHSELPAPALRTCPCCSADLPLEAFRVNRANRMGRTARCRECLTAKDRAYNETPERKAMEYVRARTPEARAKQRARDAARMAEQSAKKSRRRARLRGATLEPFSTADLYAHWDDAGYYACYWCDAPFTGTEPIHEDHVFPLSKGGAHALSNLVPSCAPCNRRKYNKDPYDFARELHPWLT
jgi:5-methylcytosine-specific restriction endonuclease McrA